MEWLGDWLRNIIMVVLFAAFVDLILPGKALERYARLVLSLLILLTLLSPIVRLLTDPPEQKLALELERQEKGLPEEMRLESILAQAEKMKDLQENQSLEWAGHELARVMKEEIGTETGESVQEVEVVLAATKGQDASYSGAAIRSVNVRLSPAPDRETRSDGEETNGDPIRVEHIEPVEVDIEKPSPAGMRSERPASEDTAALSAIDEARAGPVRDYISRRWDLKPELITIHLPEEGREDEKL